MQPYLVLQESLQNSLRFSMSEQSAASNVLGRIGQLMQIRAMEDEHSFTAMLPPVSKEDPRVKSQSLALLNVAGDQAATENQLAAVVNSLSTILEQDGESACTGGLITLAGALARCTDAQLSSIGNARFTMERKAQFTENLGGPGLTQLNESQLMRLYSAGATHVSVHKNQDNDQVAFTRFLKDHGATEIGRYTPSGSDEGADHGFVLSEAPNDLSAGLIQAFPAKIMNLVLIEKLNDALSVNLSPSGKADAVVTALPKSMKGGDLSSAAISIYLHMKQLVENGRQLDACSTLGYIMHYCTSDNAHKLSGRIAAIPLQLESDHTVNRGIVNLSQKLSEQMHSAKEVFPRRDECVEALQQQLNNPGLSDNEKLSLMSKTLHFAGGDIAQWVSHGVGWEPESQILPAQQMSTNKPPAMR